MSSNIQTLLAAIAEIRESRRSSRRTAGHSAIREESCRTALARALQAMAKEHDVLLQQPLEIDKRGEFYMVALHRGGPVATHGCGTFGSAFAAALSAHKARTGTVPGTIHATSGWCCIKAADAEKMVVQYARQAADNLEHRPAPTDNENYDG